MVLDCNKKPALFLHIWHTPYTRWAATHSSHLSAARKGTHHDMLGPPHFAVPIRPPGPAAVSPRKPDGGRGIVHGPRLILPTGAFRNPGSS
jgi:hypothetical protein